MSNGTRPSSNARGAKLPARAALIVLCRQLAQEWAANGIRVNAVCPGMIRTPLTEAVYRDDATHQARHALVPVGRIGTADEVGEVVAFLTSPGSAYVTGQALTVDGGIAEHMLGMIPGRPGKGLESPKRRRRPVDQGRQITGFWVCCQL